MEDKIVGDDSIEERLLSEEERQNELSSSSPLNLSIGRRLPGLVVPMVEGLIIGRKGREDGSVDVSMILALYIKKGVWMKAVVIVENSAKLSKRSVEKYKYPLPWGSKLTMEAVRNKGDNEWVKMTIEDINNYVKEGSKIKEVVEEEDVNKRKFIVNRRKSTLSQDSKSSKEEEKVTESKTPQRRSRRISALRKWSRESSEKDPEVARKSKDKQHKSRSRRDSIWGTSSRTRRSAHKAVRSSSESRDSSHKGELEDKEVWDTEEEDDRIVYCPFTSKDIRRFVDVKESIKGRVIERRFIRQALQNLYRHYTLLQTFVDSLRTKTNHPSSQPFPSDLVWLDYHAKYIDSLLFEDLRGMWAEWNAPVLDLLVMSFLELTVRCSPRRQYPDKLEERVRRWMKKNQIGISTAYGLIPYFLQNAKVTERGVVVTNSQSSQYARGRASHFSGGRGESRNRGGGGAASNTRRGGSRMDNKNNMNE